MYYKLNVLERESNESKPTLSEPEVVKAGMKHPHEAHPGDGYSNVVQINMDLISRIIRLIYVRDRQAEQLMGIMITSYPSVQLEWYHGNYSSRLLFLWR